VEELAACCQRDSPEAILLTHPGSPAGAPLPREVRQWLLNRSRDQGTVFVVDEVFVDFCEEESLKHSLADVERLVLIRSLTKFYALPGLRLGYLFTWEALAARLRERLPPWSVNTFAQIGGVYGLEQQGYQAETLRLIERERRNLSESLARTRAFRVHPGCANYVLFELDNNLPSAQVLRDDLVAAHGILIRDCSSFEGLGPHYARVAVRLPEENGRLLNALHSWLGRHGH
jgi:threonine-phosphate decarboxylase